MSGHCEQCGETICVCADAQSSAGEAGANLTDVLAAIGLQRAQIKKLNFLAERGGKYSAVTVHVGMPDGRLADVDPYGRVTWKAAN